VTPLAALAGEAADLLHEGVRLFAGEFADHRGEHVAEEAHVAAEEFVEGHGGGHGWRGRG